MKGVYWLLILFLLWLPHRAEAANKPPEIFYQKDNWQVLGTGPHYLDLGLGVFDLIGEYGGRASGAACIGLRPGNKLGFIGPAVGWLANTDGGWFGYGGIYADILYKDLIITPLLSAGHYEKGDGKDLGGNFQFRICLGLSWPFANRFRLGLHLAHISNAGIYDRNPGEEELLLTLGWPF